MIKKTFYLLRIYIAESASFSLWLKPLVQESGSRKPLNSESILCFDWSDDLLWLAYLSTENYMSITSSSFEVFRLSQYFDRNSSVFVMAGRKTNNGPKSLEAKGVTFSRTGHTRLPLLQSLHLNLTPIWEIHQFYPFCSSRSEWIMASSASVCEISALIMTLKVHAVTSDPFEGMGVMFTQ